jgi:hypothetical protein
MIDQLKIFEAELGCVQSLSVNIDPNASPWEQKRAAFNKAYQLLDEKCDLLEREKDNRARITIKSQARSALSSMDTAITEMDEALVAEQKRLQKMLEKKDTVELREKLAVLKENRGQQHIAERQRLLLREKFDKVLGLAVENAIERNDQAYDDLKANQEKKSKALDAMTSTGKSKQGGDRIQRRAGRKKKNAATSDDVGDIQLQELSSSYLDAESKISAERAKQEEILSVINDNLDEAHVLAQDINGLLNRHARYISELNQLITKVDNEIQQNTGMVEKLLEKDDNPLNKWCPRLICLIMVLLVVGAVFTFIIG